MTIDTPAHPTDDRHLGLAEQIMARALALWHGNGPVRQSPREAWLQAEREVLSWNKANSSDAARLTLGTGPALKEAELRIKFCSETLTGEVAVAVNGQR